MDRRTLLRAVAAGGVGATAGCLGSLTGGDDGTPDVVLPEPDLDVTIEQHRGHRYPVWGERLPDVSLPAALSGETVALRSIDGAVLLTYHFTNCRDTCPLLVAALVSVGAHAVENGYADGVTFAPITFDPTRDDAETLRAYADRMNVRRSDRWHWLRPKSEASAREAIDEELGISYRRRERASGDGYLFVHPGVVTLVNGDGYVERAYTGGTRSPPPVQTMIDDLATLRSA